MALQEAAHEAAGAAAHGGEGGGAAFPPFDPSLFASQLFWFVLSFGALYIILSRFVLPKIGGVLHTRASTISKDLDDAAQKSAEADEARTDSERATARARSHAREMVDAARAEVQAKLNAEQEAAEKRIADRINTAEARVDAAKAKALGEVPGLAEQLARDIADKIAPAPSRARAVGEA